MRKEALNTAPRRKALRDMVERWAFGSTCEIDEVGVEGVEGMWPLACPFAWGEGSSA